MKNLLKFAALGIALTVTGASAHAATIFGGIGIGAGGSYSATAVDFNPNQGVVTAASGTFSSYLFSTINLTDFTFASSNGVQLFSDTVGGNTLTFTINGPVTSSIVNNILTVTGNGTFTETGFASNTGGFTLTGSNNQVTSFEITAAATPEPNSLILMGSGLISGAGMLLRRRRSIA